MKTRISSSLLVILLTLLSAPSGSATDGYFATGYGVKQQGAGGAGVACVDDSLAAATNPAGMFFAGDRIDFGASFFRPIRGATISGSLFPVNGDYDGSGRKNFLIPELGYNRRVRSRFSLGVSVFGNGGMNTTYLGGIPLFGSGRAGVNLEQLFVAPTLAFHASKRNVFGVSLNLAYQRFQLEGLQNFASAGFSIDPANLTNRGTDSAFGAGVRVGWIGTLSRWLSLGATYQSRTHMGKFNRYRGLFAEQGGFDIPANFAGGVALKVHSRATLAFDAERILYGQVKSIANSGANPALLGSDNGPGFGWRDITAYKLGGSYRVNSTLTLRAGVNHSGQPFAATETFFNILAPGVVQNHVTAGASVRLHGGREINFFYLHAFTGSVAGVNSIPAWAGGGNASLGMHQNSAGISLGWNKE